MACLDWNARLTCRLVLTRGLSPAGGTAVPEPEAPEDVAKMIGFHGLLLLVMLV